MGLPVTLTWHWSDYTSKLFSMSFQRRCLSVFQSRKLRLHLLGQSEARMLIFTSEWRMMICWGNARQIQNIILLMWSRSESLTECSVTVPHSITSSRTICRVEVWDCVKRDGTEAEVLRQAYYFHNRDESPWRVVMWACFKKMFF